MRVSFDIPASAYTGFMGQYSEPLADLFVDWAGIASGQRALDVGCGTGALTARLVNRLGSAAVTAMDPSDAFVVATRERLPGIEAFVGSAEDIPCASGSFDVSLAQLVVHFMRDAVVGLREMSRVSRAGGVVAACVWDHAGRTGPLSLFWDAAHDLDPAVTDESSRLGTREGDLEELFTAVGLQNVESGALEVIKRFNTFDAWWEPYTLGAGPAGAYVASLPPQDRAALRARCERLLPPAPFDVRAVAWCARGITGNEH